MLVRSLALLSFAAIVCTGGCSGDGAASDAPGEKAPAANAPSQIDPAVLAANGFLSALIRGDTEAATQHLTPQAIQQFATSGQRFVALGLETAQFRLGEMRKVSESQALVQCMLTEKSTEGAPHEEEMCCVVRLVDGQWRVSGIVVDAPDGGAPRVLNFEQPEQPAQAPPPASQNFVVQPVGTDPPAVRTAQEPALPPQR